MSIISDSTWVGKKPIRRIGYLSDALSIASDLGFAVAPPPSQEELQSLASSRGDDLIRVLRELSAIQRKIADLQVELQGRKDDKNVAHLTHVSAKENRDFVKDHSNIEGCYTKQGSHHCSSPQPYSLDCIPVEAEYQKQFSELLMKAASDYGALTASVSDFQWTQNFKEPPSVWGEMLRPIPVALASCTRFFEAMSAMRESFATLQDLRVDNSEVLLPTTPGGNEMISDCVTPPQGRTISSFEDLSVQTTSHDRNDVDENGQDNRRWDQSKNQK